jgi:hypothetical protein
VAKREHECRQRKQDSRIWLSLDPDGPKRQRQKESAAPDHDYGPLAAAEDMDDKTFAEARNAVLNLLAKEVATKNLHHELQISSIVSYG